MIKVSIANANDFDRTLEVADGEDGVIVEAVGTDAPWLIGDLVDMAEKRGFLSASVGVRSNRCVIFKGDEPALERK